MDFVERIDELLKEKNLKRSALCDAVGIDITSISVWKKRGTIPAGDVCVKIARYLDVDVEYLITGIQKEKPESETAEDKMPLLLNTLSALRAEIDGVLQNTISALKK